jgi:CubicO group peptidase (beta-lactamase class C family)
VEGGALVRGHWAERLRHHAEAVGVPGAVLGVRAHDDTFAVAHGLLSTRTGVEVTPDSLFQLGSITKVWTSTMAMQLVDEGRCSLDSTLADVLPGVTVGAPDRAGDVALRHLMTHTSGVDGDIFTDTGRGDDCLQEYVELLGRAECAFSPGAAYSYCNSGFVLLGRVVEVLDGGTWDASLRRRLVEPLGLGRTVTLPEEALLHRSAVGHGDRAHDLAPTEQWALPRSLGPAGLVTASAADLLTFVWMHLDAGLAGSGRQVLAAESVSSMQRTTVPVPGGDGPGHTAVGLAWRRYDWGGRELIGHDGSTIGQCAYLRVDPQSRAGVVLLTNSALGDELWDPLVRELAPELFGVEVPAGVAPTPGPVPDAGSLRDRQGRYERAGRRFDVELRSGRLYLTSTPTGALAEVWGDEPEQVELHPSDATGASFVCRSDPHEPWTEVSFAALPDGRPSVVVFGRVAPRAEPAR